eukprot:TRINITY_DN16026_c0_g1_i1.p1 TRINITY_DN16026_c0_g1~~TRINITY_DN16026_c0_g1_i1.p1  ORF type:complete len:500 (+),score=98.48 TRINITY_DN16026_c0_g1_i1:38-1501(+)
MTYDENTASGLDEESIPGFSQPGKKSTLVGKIGNFSVQYNLGAASIAVVYLTSSDDSVIGSSESGSGDYPEPQWAKLTLLGAVFAGAVIGMLIMGYLGDLIGRRRAMQTTLSFVVFGALGAAFGPWGSANSIYAVLIAMRLLVGVGVGGIYPLSAVSSAEAAHDDDDATSTDLREQAASRVGWSFFWQVPGSMSPYIVSLLLMAGHSANSSFSVDSQFRIIFGLGAIPAALVMFLTSKERDSPEFIAAQKARQQQDTTFNPWEWARAHPQWPELRKALIGTAGTWFVYDISFYGTAIFTPTILKSIFGDSDSLVDISWQSIVSTAFGVPGCICGIWYLKKGGCFKLNLYGFLLMAVCFALLATVYSINEDLHALIFILFLILNFAINNGPSVATFVVPALIFPTEVRSSFHGVSAACAKLGAVTGTFMYAPLSDATSFAFVMWVQAGFSLLGAVVTYFFIPRTDVVIGEGYKLADGESDDERGVQNN